MRGASAWISSAYSRTRVSGPARSCETPASTSSRKRARRFGLHLRRARALVQPRRFEDGRDLRRQEHHRLRVFGRPVARLVRPHRHRAGTPFGHLERHGHGRADAVRRRPAARVRPVRVVVDQHRCTGQKRHPGRADTRRNGRLGHALARVGAEDRSQELRRLVEDVQSDGAGREQIARAIDDQAGELLGLEHAAQGDRDLVQSLKHACTREVDVGGHPAVRCQPTAHAVTHFTWLG